MNKKQKKIIIFLCSFLFLLTSLCFLNESQIASAATKSSVSLNNSYSYLVKGETTKLKVNGTTKKVVWTTTDKYVATVSSSGKVTAVGHGTAYIKAKVNNKIYKCKVTVLNPAEIFFESPEIVVLVNGTGVTLKPDSYMYSAALLKKAGFTYKVSESTGVKVSKTGTVTASKAGTFKIDAYLHGIKIETINMEAISFEGFTVSELPIETQDQKLVGFKGGIRPVYEEVKVSSSNNLIAEVETDYDIDLDSDITRCKGVYVRGIKEGTCTITVTISGISKNFTVVVGDGLEKLAPLEAIKNNDFTGYTGNSLTCLIEIRRFIDENDLLSTSLSDREKVTIIQNYLNATYTGNLTDSTYRGHISQVFLKGAGVCQSYATFFCFICECIDVDVLYCGGGVYRDNEIIGHAWNRVKVDGTWYYIDSYWNAIGNYYDYFLSETLWSDRKLSEEGLYADCLNDYETTYSNNID